MGKDFIIKLKNNKKKEVQEGGNKGIPMAGSYWCMTETNTIL